MCYTHMFYLIVYVIGHRHLDKIASMDADGSFQRSQDRGMDRPNRVSDRSIFSLLIYV